MQNTDTEAGSARLALSPQRVADTLDVSRITVWRLVRDKKLKVVYVAPRCPRITMTSLEAYLAELLEEAESA